MSEIEIINVRSGDLQSGAQVIYVGRAMPGREGSVFGNPLPVVGGRWTAEAQAWSEHLARHADPGVVEIAREAMARRGYERGQAAGLYLHVLREQCRRDSPQRRELLRLAWLHLQGVHLALQCWCHPNPCHATVICQAVLGYASRLAKQ